MLLKTNKKSPIQYLNPGALSAEKWAHGDGRTKKSEQEPRDRSGWRLIPPLPPRGPTAEGCGRGAGGPEACPVGAGSWTELGGALPFPDDPICPAGVSRASHCLGKRAGRGGGEGKR